MKGSDMVARRLSPRCRDGFTLVELTVALIVSSVVLTAVATLAYALSSAVDSTDDTSRKQAQVRYATMRLSELVRHSRLVCYSGPAEFALWRADENGDGQINFSELVYIEKGSAGDHLHLCWFPISWGWDPVVKLSDIGSYSSRWWTMYNMYTEEAALISECANVEFSFDALPPQTEFVNILFDLTEDGIPRRYQINALVRGRAANLLNEAGDALVSDDD